ncbi:MAG: glycosyltransferase family 4 protein [Verrucomicrobiales bacterium]|nr:glycosyltransferase family 4 protein [Verrucomicrobiales bacterium]
MTNSLKILWVKSGPLYPLDTGGKIRTHAMLSEINKDHKVTYLAFKENDSSLHHDEETAPYAIQKSWIPWREAATGTVKFFLQLFNNLLFSSLPYALAKYQAAGMSSKILKLDASGDFDLIICDFLSSAPNFRAIHSQLKTPTVLFQHNIESQIWKRLATSKRNVISQAYFSLQYRRMFRWERKLSLLFDGIITVSQNDADFCKEAYHLNNIIGAVPTGVNIVFFSPKETAAPKPARIAFLGSMDWMPNIECVQYFVAKVLPLIHTVQPELSFYVIGRNPAPVICELTKNHRSVELTGTVDDIRPHLQSCNLMIVPLHAGGGTRIKIFEAMAMGIPVVSTTIGAEGLPVTHGKDILIANRDQDLADACLQLLQNPDLAKKIAIAGREKVEQDHSWHAVSEQFIKLCCKHRSPPPP